MFPDGLHNPIERIDRIARPSSLVATVQLPELYPKLCFLILETAESAEPAFRSNCQSLLLSNSSQMHSLATATHPPLPI
jgi:hypothetical protein